MIRYAMYGPGGVKRKHSEVDGMEEAAGTYIEQRQAILDVSMYKLRMLPARRTEPSLRRSVLIYNTLRVIEHELQAEGVPPNPGVTPFPPLQSDDVSEMTLDALPVPGADHAPLSRPDCPPSPLPTPMETLVSLGEVPRTPFCPPLPCAPESPQTPATAAAALHHHHPPSPEVADDAEAEPEPIIYTLQPVTNAHKLASPTTDALLNNDRLAPFSTVLFDLDSRTAGYPVPALPSACSVTHLAAAAATTQRLHHHGQHHGQVDIFGDIDLTLYDFDLLSSFTSNVKMAPLSAEELMHSFPTDSPPSLSSPSPCFRNELLNDDLDHIMQVLVGI